MKKNKYLNSNFSEIRKGCIDNFHAFLVEGAVFDGYYDIPFIQKQKFELPYKLVSYVDITNYRFEKNEFVHFYLDDQKFDGAKGIWTGFTKNIENKRGFNLKKFRGAAGIISPDFSLYMDMPRNMQIYNVYRSRAIGCYFAKLGFNVIPNIRWTDEESYKFAFDGIYQNQIIAVGTLGCAKEKLDKMLFINGFLKMVEKLKPQVVVIYGQIFKELENVIKCLNINVKQYRSDTNLFFKGDKYGNES